MVRMIFLLIGLALIGLGIYWRWFEPTAAERPVVTELATAVRMVRDGEGRIPVRIQAPPAFVPVHRTPLIRPGYAPCRAGDAGDDASAVTALGCRRRIDAALEAGGWRIEQTASDNSGQQVACLRVLLFPIAATAGQYWYATSPRQVSTERACRAPVRSRFPWAVPNTRLRYDAIDLGDTAALQDAERAWEQEGRSGYLTRIEDLAYNQFWRDESFEALAQAIAGQGAAHPDGPPWVLVAGRELGLPTPASLLLVDTAAGRMAVRMASAAAAPPPPWQGVIDVPGVLEGRLVAGMQDAQPLWAALELGSVEALDADDAETAVFSMGLGGGMLFVAALLQAGAALRRGVAPRH